MSKAFRWTPDRLTTLKRMLSEDHSCKEIAVFFGKSEENIRKVISVYKLRTKLQEAGSGHTTLNKRVKETDIATRIRILEGKELRVESLRATFTDEQLKSWLGDENACERFCKEVLHITLQTYQLEMIRNMLTRKRCVFILGRQSGKDFTISCFAIWSCITQSNTKILLVSPAQRQSDLLFNRILNFVASSEQLFDSVSKSNMECLNFTNASQIYNLPATSFIRGFTEVSHIFVNESCHGLPDEMISAVLEPMLAIRNGSLFLFSTPLGCQGTTWDAFNSELYAKMHLPSTVNKYLSPEWFEIQKQTMPSELYDREILANFSEAVNSFFRLELIKKQTEDYTLRSDREPNKLYYAGIDWGRVRDSSVITILSKQAGEFKVENIYEMVNVPFPQQVEFICKLHEKWKFTRITSEYNGLGIFPTEELYKRGLPVQKFLSTVQTKEEAYNHLLKNLEDGKLTIPNHRKLQHELRTFNFEYSASGRMKLHHVEGGSDDYVDSLCFANWASKISSTGFFIMGGNRVR